MTDRQSAELESLERATCPSRAAPADDPELAGLGDGWRVLAEALAPLRAQVVDEELLVARVRRRARRAAGWRGMRWLVAASLVLAAIGYWPQLSTPTATVPPPADGPAVVDSTTTTAAIESTTFAAGSWDDELDDEFSQVEAEVQRVERRWRTPPDAFASLRWRMQELETQVAQSSL